MVRAHCHRHRDLLPITKHSFRSLQDVPASNIVLLAPIPEYPDPNLVEISPEAWQVICGDVHTVTISLESVMSGSKHPLAQSTAGPGLWNVAESL